MTQRHPFSMALAITSEMDQSSSIYTEHHHYTGDTGEHHAHQDGMPKSRNFAAEIGDKLSPKMKQQQYESSTGSSSHDAHNKSGKQWDPLERELQDNEWDQIGNL
ncbi:hypothetical protein PG999_007660 [Apiospora kogelbergensis]|uniref:Uncharacterized protein n=1 Tax=Apiospora kogelbergensis TaxID=1337665 RepID=A0AAW0QR04_9PEZI